MLRRTLETVFAAIRSFTGSAELFIADDGAISAETHAWIAARAEETGTTFVYRAKSEDERGLWKSRQIAVRECRGDVVTFFDDDVLVDPNYIAGVMRRFRQDAGVAGVGGVDTALGTARMRWRFFSRLFFIASSQPGVLSRTGQGGSMWMWIAQRSAFDSEYLSGCNMSFRRATLCPLPDAPWLSGYSMGEDLLLGAVASASGRLVVDPDLRVVHLVAQGGRPVGAAKTAAEIASRSRLLAVRGEQPWVLFTWWGLLGSAMRSAVQGRFVETFGYLRGFSATRRSALPEVEEFRNRLSTRVAARRTVRVVFIAGAGRSGSTLVDRLIGDTDGYVSVGELGFIWRNGLVENQLCGCGTPFRECDYWRSVFTYGFGGIENVNAEEMRALFESVNRIRYIPSALLGLRATAYASRVRNAGRHLAALYDAIAAVNDGATIVDSTKDPAYAALLTTVPTLDLRFLHVVRDPRAVAYSWTRLKRMPEVHWTEAHMPRQSVGRSSLLWLLHNASAELLRVSGVRRTRIRYEDVADSPGSVLSKALRTLELPTVDVRREEIVLHQSHTVSGNPMRFETGRVGVKVDDEWRRRLSTAAVVAVTVITAPLSFVYGYVGHRLNPR